MSTSPPTAQIFYNGVEKRPEKQELKLSSSYNVAEKEPSLELRATLLNINPGCNEELKAACKTLKDYGEYTARVRRYAEVADLEEAVERAINECIREGILSDFLKASKSEAKKMSIYEYDEELHMRQTREEGREEGKEEGLTEAIFELLSELGNVSDELRIEVLNQKDTNVLKKWVKLAAKANSIEEFKQSMEVDS